MQAIALTAKPSARSVRSRILISYTCPRCRQYLRSSACSRCGWALDQPVAGAQTASLHRDRLNA